MDMRPLVSAIDPLKSLADVLPGDNGDCVDTLFHSLHAAITPWYNEWGHTRIVKLFACSPQMRLRVIAHALWSGNLSVLTVLPVEMLRAVPTRVVDFAAFRGHMCVLKYLHDVVGIDVSTPGAMYNAAQYGHLAVIRYLYELDNETNVRDAVIAAAQNGYLEVVKFCHIHCVSCDVRVAFLCAIDHERLAVAQYILATVGKDDLDGLRPMDYAAVAGRMASLKWLHQQHFDCTTNAMDRAAGFGDLDVVQWLHANRPEGCTDKAMCNAATNGHLNIVEWLFSNRHEGCAAGTLSRTTSNEHWEVVRFLATHGIDTDNAQAAFIIARSLEHAPDDVVTLLLKSAATESSERQRKKRCL